MMNAFAMLVLLCAPQDDFIPLKKGAKWIYKFSDKDVVQSVTGTEKIGTVDTFVVESDMSGQKERMWIAPNAEGMWLHKVHSGDSVSELPKPAMLLKYPLKSGDTWESKIPTGDAIVEYAFENAGEEEVTVPAGKYTAWKIKMRGKMGGVQFSGTYWYSKGVGLVKQSISSPGGEFRLELKEFKP
jgi:hypothetical protein